MDLQGRVVVITRGKRIGRVVEQRLAERGAAVVLSWGGEDEIAKTVITLLEADFITGETIRVDGGRHLR